MVRALLKTVPAGTYSAEDFLDDDGIGPGRIRIRATLRVGHGTLEVDFTGTDQQVAGASMPCSPSPCRQCTTSSGH